MERRSFFGRVAAGLGALLAWMIPKPTQGELTAMRFSQANKDMLLSGKPGQFGEDLEAALACAGRDEQCGPYDHLIAPNFNPYEDRLLVVGGTTLPGGPRGSELVYRMTMKGPDGKSEWGFIEDHTRPMSELQEGQYPRVKEFRVLPQVMVGTIDELVETYRLQLADAVRMWLMLDDKEQADPTPQQARIESVKLQPYFAELVASQKGDLVGRRVPAAIEKVHHMSGRHPQLQEFDERKEKMDHERIAKQRFICEAFDQAGTSLGIVVVRHDLEKCVTCAIEHAERIRRELAFYSKFQDSDPTWPHGKHRYASGVRLGIRNGLTGPVQEYQNDPRLSLSNEEGLKNKFRTVLLDADGVERGGSGFCDSADQAFGYALTWADGIRSGKSLSRYQAGCLEIRNGLNESVPPYPRLSLLSDEEQDAIAEAKAKEIGKDRYV